MCRSLAFAVDVFELIEKSMVNRAAERPVEYAFAWSVLAPLTFLPAECRRRVRILDVGGGESRLAKTLAELGFSVTVIDIGDVDRGGAELVRANVLSYEFPEASFDLIVAISTVEHVGLPCYGQTLLDPDGDVKVMEKIHRWLKPSGLAVVTVPFGKPHHPPSFERVYNRDALQSRIIGDRWRPLLTLFACSSKGWRTCSMEEAETCDACALLLLVKGERV